MGFRSGWRGTLRQRSSPGSAAFRVPASRSSTIPGMPAWPGRSRTAVGAFPADLRLRAHTQPIRGGGVNRHSLREGDRQVLQCGGGVGADGLALGELGFEFEARGRVRLMGRRLCDQFRRESQCVAARDRGRFGGRFRPCGFFEVDGDATGSKRAGCSQESM